MDRHRGDHLLPFNDLRRVNRILVPLLSERGASSYRPVRQTYYLIRQILRPRQASGAHQLVERVMV